MTTPDHVDRLGPTLPDPVADYMLFQAKKLVAGSGSNPRRVLWSCKFRFPNMGTDTALELLPTLALRIRNQKTGEVLVQTEPVEFGRRITGDEVPADEFLDWCQSKRFKVGGQQAGDAAQKGGDS